MEPRSTQTALARSGFAFGGASVILPFIGLLTFSGADFTNPFWLKCAGMAFFAVIAGWLLHRLEKGVSKRPTISWIVVALYFTTVLSLIWRFFGGALSAFMLFGLPELGGLVTCLAGIIHSLVSGNKIGEAVVPIRSETPDPE